MRTSLEIERDYKKIREIVETTDVSSIREISEITGLSPMEIRTSLSKHPRVEKTIYERISENKKLKKMQRKNRNSKVAESKSSNIENKEELQENQTLNYVIDASICGNTNCFNIISDVCKINSKIIITSITLKELNNMQQYDDADGKAAKKMLAIAAENPNTFIGVKIDEKLGKPDDCIIKYCSDNKNNVLLYTSDKEMALNARMAGVQTEYLKKNIYVDRKNSVWGTHNIVDTKKINENLFIKCYSTASKSICVISNGIEYKEGLCELHIGDDVYIATKKENYVTFAHYRITSLYVNKNSIIVYHCRIYKREDIAILPRATYKSFVRELMSK